MKILITGANGQLGQSLQVARPKGIDIVALSHSQLDVTSKKAIQERVAKLCPDVVINAAAYTAVDQAETEAKVAFGVNADGPLYLAEVVKHQGLRLIHISTDFVFDGAQSTPYLSDNQPSPLNIYGMSKWEGEKNILNTAGDHALILRSSWLYAEKHDNFVTRILALLREKKRLDVVVDQVGSPTWARSLAQAIWCAVGQPNLKGVYHWSDAGVASRYDFAVAIQQIGVQLQILDKAIPIMPVRTADHGMTIRRPAYSVLDVTKTIRDFNIRPTYWRDALTNMMMGL